MATRNIFIFSGLTLCIALMCGGIIANSKETFNLTNAEVMNATALFETPVEETRFERWKTSMNMLDKFNYPQGKPQKFVDEEAQQKDMMTSKFKDDNNYHQEIKQVEEKLQILTSFEH